MTNKSTSANSPHHTSETTPETNATKSSHLLRKAKQGLTSVLAGAAMLGMVESADAQIQELGTLDDGTRNSWLLKDMGQEIVYWDEMSPYQQGFAIYQINTPDPEDWMDDSTKIFDALNSEITVDNISDNPSEIVETEVDGRQARKIHFDQLQEGNYVLQTMLHASSPTNPQAVDNWITRLFIDVDADGNQKVFKITGYFGLDTDQFWGNRIGADATAIEFEEQPQSQMKISLPVPTMADGSTDRSLDMDEWRQTEASLVFKLNDGTEITKTADEIEYDLDSNRLITSIPQASGQYVVAIATQHTGIDDIEITGPVLDIASQMIAKSINVYPNPVSQGQALTIEMPEGIAALNVAYAIYDITGREVMQGILDDKTALMHSLSSGTYILKLALGQSVHSKKFIVK